MRQITIGFLIVFAINGMLAGNLRAAKPVDELQVLFIGNSFTYAHDLPKMLGDLAVAGKQRPLKFEQETPGGCTLEKHWKDGLALKKIQSRRWDFVVLQDQSQMPLLQPKMMAEFAKKLDEPIQKQGAKTILYLTWAMQDAPETQPTISKAYQDLAKELKAQVAPVGNAWELAIQADKKLVLHEADKKHPNVQGTYLAACVFYATIYGKSPEGLPGSAGGLTDAQARPLQAIAWKAVQASQARAGK